MSFEQIKRNVSGYIETRRELRLGKSLINESEGRVNMTAYIDENDTQGKRFGPIGYNEDEYDALRREIKNAKKVKLVGLTTENELIDTVIIVNRSRK